MSGQNKTEKKRKDTEKKKSIKKKTLPAKFAVRSVTRPATAEDYEIIPLIAKHAATLARIDHESEHKGGSLLDLSIKDRLTELLERFKKGHEIFFGYKEGDEFKAYITLKPFFPGHKHCEIYWLAVRKKYQGQGIGTTLLRFMEDYAKKHGFRKVCLYTGKDMMKTRHFYEKRGYYLVNEFPEYYGFPSGNTTAVLYAKKL